eukprot:3550207-Amphidinium_carterae.1
MESLPAKELKFIEYFGVGNLPFSSSANLSHNRLSALLNVRMPNGVDTNNMLLVSTPFNMFARSLLLDSQVSDNFSHNCVLATISLVTRMPS